MNVALFTFEYAHKNTPIYGGIGTYFQTIAKELNSRGINVVVYIYYPYRTKDKISSFRDGNIEVEVLENYSSKHFFYRKLRQISLKLGLKKLYLKLKIIEYKSIANSFLKFIENKNIDIIQTHDYKAPISYLKTDIPKVIRCSGSVVMLVDKFNYCPINHEYEIIKIFEQKAFKNADYITAVSDFSAKTTQELFNTEEIKVINNGFDYQLIKVDGIEEISYSIFYFGSVNEGKGIKTLAKTFNTIQEKEPRANLHIIGKGKEYWDYIKSDILSDSARKKTTYYGQKNKKELYDLISKASIFIFPTHGENFPFVFIEAMAFGKPIIVNNIEVAFDIIDNETNGFIVEKEEDYIEIVLDLFKNPEKRKEIGQNAREKVKNHFSIEQMTNKTIELYKDILSDNNI